MRARVCVYNMKHKDKKGIVKRKKYFFTYFLKIRLYCLIRISYYAWR